MTSHDDLDRPSSDHHESERDRDYDRDYGHHSSYSSGNGSSYRRSHDDDYDGGRDSRGGGGRNDDHDGGGGHDRRNDDYDYDSYHDGRGSGRRRERRRSPTNISRYDRYGCDRDGGDRENDDRFYDRRRRRQRSRYDDNEDGGRRSSRRSKYIHPAVLQAQMAGGSNVAVAAVSAVAAAAAAAVQVPNAQTEWVLDEARGYYFDKITNYYFDPVTKVYYCGTTGGYYTRDDTTGAYTPIAPPSATVEPVLEATEEDEKEKKRREAEEVARNMAKWEKQQKKKAEKEAAAVAAAVAEAEIVATSTSSINLPVASANSSITTPLVPTGSSAVSSSPFHGDYIDWNGLVCTLCKRKFTAASTLVKHQASSELHRNNVAADRPRKAMELGLSLEAFDAEEALWQERERVAVAEAGEAQGGFDAVTFYRDRARERRDKFGQPDKPLDAWLQSKPVWLQRQHNDRFHSDYTEGIEQQPASDGIREDNKGNQLLRKMGWKEGTGLGKDGDGIVTPIMAERRSANSGLGAGATWAASGGDPYSNLAQATQARYARLQDTLSVSAEGGAGEVATSTSSKDASGAKRKRTDGDDIEYNRPSFSR